MWSLGRIIPHPEVTRVYIGSFWEEPYQHDFFENLFTKEQMDLFEDINQLPANNLLQKINNLVRRAKECKALARLISYLQKESDVWVQSAVKQEILSGSGWQSALHSSVRGYPAASPSTVPPNTILWESHLL